ncbi:collagen alpha-1(XIV) chain isoform X2 [Eurytemora carolleeae]|uniref:collagen alpha-1(XIV) chain isoform X1 n=1 Tax=Eurytemora carolleeae TaxID=1294199 RepID=UPI000C762679|nr:collagen alpha-1(XIV) chain isoform X1 [Eurytemora carolleeae]XP_023337719.1 collagen alpha-1(XIV) chain isoform X2 [Eurytemora carolleeae]|eukprot:XP_023337718.1 collagen alpha-1(XIV) chain-like isoform X1 [Eurytemora affinis]
MLKWVAPDGHSRLKAYNLLCTSKDNKSQKELAVKHKSGTPVNSFLFENLPSATEFNVTITTVCVYEKLKTISEEEKISFITIPLPPRNLELESRFCNSFQVKWEAPVATAPNHKFKLTIQAPSIGYSNSYEVGGDKRTFNFSKLPEIVGTGETYNVCVTYCVQPTGSDHEVVSEGLTESFVTKPLPPSNLKLGPGWNQITWTKSPTPHISVYKLRFKSAEEGSKSEEILIPPEEGVEPCSCLLEGLVFGVQYKVNIYAVVDIKDSPEGVESKELHEKIVQTEGGLIVYSEELDEGLLSRQVSEVVT